MISTDGYDGIFVYFILSQTKVFHEGNPWKNIRGKIIQQNKNQVTPW